MRAKGRFVERQAGLEEPNAPNRSLEQERITDAFRHSKWERIPQCVPEER